MQSDRVAELQSGSPLSSATLELGNSATRFKAVLFDWDGTIVDTAEASYRCYVRMFADFNIAFDRDAYQRTYSPNWYQTFRIIGLSEDLWHEADTRWLAYFAEETVGLMTGAREALEVLTMPKGIVTSGGRDRVSRELDHHGLAHHFQHVVFGTDARERKPHPEALHLCLDRLGIAAEEAVYVGDSPEDVQMAKAANVFSVAVPGGYPNLAALEAAQPDVMAVDILDAVRRLR
ncbi:MAG TPA: HAD family hydrolase [Thermoanaerobaculia bacterium]|nr:HAD family hydrolase [Thermoanaerobaculia bacterium]